MQNTVTTFGPAFTAMAEKVHTNALNHGWWDEERSVIGRLHQSKAPPEEIASVIAAFVAAKIALIHSEASEALEAVRQNSPMDDKLTHRSAMEVELADIVIRIMDMSRGYNLDVGGAIVEKHLFNVDRPRKHGKVL